MGMLLLSPSCTDDDVNLNPEMKKAYLPDEIPYGELGSGKLLFTRGYTSHLIDIDRQSVTELNIDPVGQGVLSPDGEMIAYVSYEEKLHLWNILTKELETRPFANVDFNLLSWSPDSENIYYSTVYTNKLYELRIKDNSYTRTFIREFPVDNHYLSPYSVSVQGDYAFYVTASQNSQEFAYDGLYTMNPEGNESECISRWEGDFTWHSHCSPMWSPDGKTIAYLSIVNYESTSTQEIILIDKDGSNIRSLVKKEIPSAHVPFAGWGIPPSNIRLSWSPDGSRIAFIGMEGDSESHLYIVDVLTGELIQVTSEKGVEDRSVFWSR